MTAVAPVPVPGKVMVSGKFVIAEAARGELVVTWDAGDGGPVGEIRLPAAIVALIKSAAAGEKVSLAAVARAVRGQP